MNVGRFQLAGQLSKKSHTQPKGRDWYKLVIGYVGGNLQLTVNREQFDSVVEGDNIEVEGEVSGGGQFGDPRLRPTIVRKAPQRAAAGRAPSAAPAPAM